MTTKKFTLTAEIEYDPTSTSAEGIAIPMHQLLESGLGIEQLVDDHGELALHSCEVSDESDEWPLEEPPRLFDEEGDSWTRYGKEIGRRVGRAIRSIAEDCLRDGVDLRHAAFIAQQEVSTEFLRVSSKKRFVEKKS